MKQKQGTFLGQKRLTRAKALPRLIQVVAFTDFGIGVLELLAAKQQQSARGWRECTMDWRTVAKRCRRHRSPDSILWSASEMKTRFLEHHTIYWCIYYRVGGIKDSIYLTLLVEGGELWQYWNKRAGGLNFQTRVGTVEIQMSVYFFVFLSQKIFSLNLNTLNLFISD